MRPRDTGGGATPDSAAPLECTPSVAGRWFNLATELCETDGDVWIHRADDKIWWTVSRPEEVVTTLESGGPGVPAGSKVYVLRKPANAWSSKSKKGADLSWDGLHARAREFLFLEGQGG